MMQAFKSCKIAATMLFVSIVTVGCDDGNDQVTLKMGHSLDTTHSVHQAMLYMNEQLVELSGGEMSIEVYPSGQLGSERDMMELLQIGSLAITKVSTSPMEGFVPDMKVFSIPYIFRDEDHLWKVLESDIGKKLLLAGESVRLRGLAYYDSGSRSFYTTNKPIYKPEDVKGLKIRVQKSPTSVKMIEALGGAATPISFGELYTALQQGVVDGAENNPPSFHLAKHSDVAKFYTLDMHTSVPDMILISSHIWGSLTAEQQVWLQQAADLSVPYQRKLWQESTDAALKAAEEAGVTIIHPDKAAFQAAMKDMHLEYKDDPVYEIMQQIPLIK